MTWRCASLDITRPLLSSTQSETLCLCLWDRQGADLARLPSLESNIRLPLPLECRRNRGVHCGPKQGLLWERHCVHENAGHSCGTYQDLLHWQLWQPCMLTLNLHLFHCTSIEIYSCIDLLCLYCLHCLRALPLSSGEAQSLSSGEPAITPWSTSPARTWLFSGTARQLFTSEQDLSGRSWPEEHFRQSKSWRIKYKLVCRLFVLQGLLSGLCGNFDSVTVNDMTTSSHIEVNNAQTFGDSWALGQVSVNSSLFLALLLLL